jgi:hypothetical protein
MPATIRHIIIHGDTSIALTPEEARVVIHGEIPRGLVTILQHRGLTLPPRGTVRYHLSIVLPDRIIQTEAHMRRLPDYERAA